MTEIKTVAIAGASGLLGKHVLPALIAAGFTVTILARTHKPDQFPSNAKISIVDFSSLSSLTSALQGIDAVVSTVGHAGIAAQRVLIDAAAGAGVKRFMPSEYSSVSWNPAVKELPAYNELWEIRTHLIARCADQGTTKMSWTVFTGGIFLEMVFGPRPVLLDFEKRKAALFDEGENRMSATTLRDVARGIAGVLRKHEETRNRIVKISQVVLTQNRLLRLAREVAPEREWELSRVQSSAMLEGALKALREGGAGGGPGAELKVILATVAAGDRYGAAYDETDNELLGVKEITDEELKGLMAPLLK